MPSCCHKTAGLVVFVSSTSLKLSLRSAARDPQEIVLDETAAANPEEIELDAADDASDAAEQDAEAAKQDMAEDNSMFQSETLHNFGGVILPEDGSAGSANNASAAISPALQAAMNSDKQKPE